MQTRREDASQTNWIASNFLPVAVELFVGSGPDVYHALELANALTALGVTVDVRLSMGPARTIPPSVWFSLCGCRNVLVADEANHDAGQLDVIGVCLLPGDTYHALSGSREPLFLMESVSPQHLVPFTREQAYTKSVLDGVRLTMSRRGGSLSGRRIIVTAGGTREPLDPVRSITNRSSGRMGHALAQAALDRGANVVLVSSARHLAVPVGAEIVYVTDVASLRSAVLEAAADADALIMAAAVSDYRPRTVHKEKIKKSSDGLTLELETVANFIPEIPGHVVRVGFAAETDMRLERAQDKRQNRGFDLLCLNDVSRSDTGFDSCFALLRSLGGVAIPRKPGVAPRLFGLS